MNIPEVVLEVLVRLSLKNIARFRSVCTQWKFLIDSDFFRVHFISRNSSSSVSWSIINTRPHKLTLEIIGHHGCKTWELTRSLGSLMNFVVETTITKLLVLTCTDGLVLIYAEASNGAPMYYVGNPLSYEWFRIPLPHFLSCQRLVRFKTYERFTDTGLVTKMQNGFLVSYKVVWLITHGASKVGFAIYSSDTGKWDIRNVTCLHSQFWLNYPNSIALNGILHWFSNLNTSFVAYDFYGGDATTADDSCCIIDFPDSVKDYEAPRFRKTITTSEGSIVYFNEFQKNGNCPLRVWKLVKYTNGTDDWQLIWEVSLVSLTELGIDYFPVVMHPLNSEIIYLWSMGKKGMVLFNLGTYEFSIHKENEEDSKCMDGCTLSFDGCSEYMERICGYFFPSLGGPNHLLFSQYVLPRWLQRLPRSQHT